MKTNCIKLIGLSLLLILFYGCAGGGKKSDSLADGAAPSELMGTLQFIPVQEFDKETGLALPYESKENPYLALKGRIKKTSVTQFIQARRAVRAERWQQADEVLKRITEEDKSLSGPWLLRGEIAEKREQQDDALEFFNKAIEINPKNINAYLHLANLQRKQGEFIKAQNTYAQALTIWPDFPEAHLNLGVLYDIYLNFPLRAQKHMEAYQFLTGGKNREVARWLEEVKSRTGIATELKPESNKLNTQVAN